MFDDTYDDTYSVPSVDYSWLVGRQSRTMVVLQFRSERQCVLVATVVFGRVALGAVPYRSFFSTVQCTLL